MNVSYSDRIKNLIYTPANYSYSMYTYSGNRISNTSSIVVNITKRGNYNDCLSMNLSNSLAYLAANYSTNNNTIYFEYDQNVTMVLEMLLT